MLLIGRDDYWCVDADNGTEAVYEERAESSCRGRGRLYVARAHMMTHRSSVRLLEVLRIARRKRPSQIAP